MGPVFPLTIFYDGACIVCATEMDLYRRRDRQGRLTFVDISDPAFEAQRYGRTLEEFMAQLHVQDANGRYYLAVDAFWAIWQAFPSHSIYGLMGRAIRLPGLHLLARLGYRTFARLRKYLPKKKGACPEGVCNLGHGRK